MIRLLAFLALLAPGVALAQTAGGCPPGAATPSHCMHQSMNGHHMTHGSRAATVGSPAMPIQPGQSAFAAIQEIVGILEADPKTDWSKVNIDALRQHLVDMSNVTLAATVQSTAIDGGVRFDVTGEGAVRDSIRRMTSAHASTMNGVDGWRFEASEIDGGASLAVHAPPAQAQKLHGLGFFGVLTLGMHHQLHHLMLARGENPHG